RMKSSTAPSGGPFPWSWSGSSAIRLGTNDFTPPGPAQLLDQPRQLLELGRVGSAEQIEEHRLGAGQGGAGLLAQAQAGLAIGVGAGDDRVLGEKDGEIAADQVAHGLEDADVRLHPGDDGLLAAAPHDLARRRLVGAAGKL